ncbi:MAG: transporter substrate-binding domain-containing protein [Clostridiales bacterium]|nr:transporter substrate-binding domain-containing protein [Clostridiales bacterium]
MKSVRIIAALAALLICLASLSACGGYTPTVAEIQKKGTITMATNASFPPFEFTEGVDENGKTNYVGIDIEIFKEIAKDLGVSWEVMDMEFAGIIGAVQTGKADLGIAGMSVTEERKKSVDFTVEYFTSQNVIVVLADNTDINAAADVAGKIIAVQTGTTSDMFASSEDFCPGATVQRYSSFIDAASAVKTGKADCMVVDIMTAGEILAQNSDLRQLEEPLADEAYAIAVQKGNTTLLEAVNNTLNRLISEGKIGEYVEQFTAEAEG